jgi:hypothetical protein
LESQSINEDFRSDTVSYPLAESCQRDFACGERHRRLPQQAYTARINRRIVTTS